MTSGGDCTGGNGEDRSSWRTSEKDAKLGWSQDGASSFPSQAARVTADSNLAIGC